MQLNEAQTRALLINPQLVTAGWKLHDRSLVRFEIPVDGYDAEPWNGVTDYCLYDHAGNVLAVVEAKAKVARYVSAGVTFVYTTFNDESDLEEILTEKLAEFY